MKHNIWFIISLMILMIGAILGAMITPWIAFIGVVFSGLFFLVWAYYEDKEQKKNREF